MFAVGKKVQTVAYLETLRESIPLDLRKGKGIGLKAKQMY